jgi:tetratricopeptide (TPR) repeat protein
MLPIRAVVILVSLATLAMAARAQTGPTPQAASPASRVGSPVGSPVRSPVGSIVQNSTGANSTNIGIINGQVTINGIDPAVLVAMTKTFADQQSATTADKAKAEARAAEMAAKLGITTSAVGAFFKIIGEQNVSEDELAPRLIEIATHFRQTQCELGALKPDDRHAAELADQAKQALEAGRLDEADTLLDKAQEVERAGARQVLELRKKAQEAEDRYDLNAAKLLSGRGNIASAQWNYTKAAGHFQQASTLVPGKYVDEHASYLDLQAGALYRQADRHLDDVALRSSIDTYRPCCRSGRAIGSRSTGPRHRTASASRLRC